MACAICAMVRVQKTNPRQSRGLTGIQGVKESRRRAFTLIEMLIAMAITLVMMGAVVTLFANITNSVRNRRATTEMSGQLRHVRNVLQQDLQGATCPGVTWQRPESNHGYIEIVEGRYHEGYATNLIDGDPTVSVLNPEIDHKVSTIPSSNPTLFNGPHPDWATDGAGLGDFDDVLMLTSRNEREPFNGRIPKAYSYDVKESANCVRPDDTKANLFGDWTAADSISSPLAEVVWFCNENPGYTDSQQATDPTAGHFFGEPGFRTVYRRTLLIVPWLNPYRYVDKNGVVFDTFTYDGATFKAEPGLLRILPRGSNLALEEAIASLVAFQDRYDISARLEWDANIKHWKIMANTLADLTKRENRFCHYGYSWGPGTPPPSRGFPFRSESLGRDYPGTNVKVGFANDPEVKPPTTPAKATGRLTTIGNLDKTVGAYVVDINGSNYFARPFAYIEELPPPNTPPTFVHATAQAILSGNGDGDGSVVRVVHGPVPLWGQRRGEDVMMTDVLAFDLRVYDPGAPIFATYRDPTNKALGLDVVMTPSDPGWRGTPPLGSDGAYMNVDNMGSGTGAGKGIGNTVATVPYVGQGAYVDMGYGYDPRFQLPSQPIGMFPTPQYASSYASAGPAWFFEPRGLCDVFGATKSPGFCVYDTWSFHYENNGIDEDFSGVVDQGTNGLDDRDFRTHSPFDAFDPGDFAINGVDDVGERETTPPYDKPLRGMQAIIRTYERDSRAIRQVRVNQHFMQE